MGDDIPGGMLLENLGPHPVRVYSHTERRRLMQERGLEEYIRHTPVPGTDKSPHTTDWSKGSIDAKTMENAAVLVARQSEPKLTADEEFARRTLTGFTVDIMSEAEVVEFDRLVKHGR